MKRILAVCCLSFCIAVNTAAKTATPQETDQMESQQPLSELVKYGVTQGGLFLLLVAVLWQWRRDNKSQVEREQDRIREAQERVAEERADRRILLDALEKSTIALRDTAVANAHQTDATNRLATLIEVLVRKV